MKLKSTFILLFLLVSCVPMPNINRADIAGKSERKVESTPPNVELRSYIGETLYSYDIYESTPLIVFDNPEPFLFPKPIFDNWSGLGFDENNYIRVESGEFSRYRGYYENSRNKLEVWILCGNIDRNSSYNNDMYFAYFVVKNNKILKLSYKSADVSYKFIPPVKLESKVIRERGESIFSWELIYQGIQNNSLVFAYREYSKNKIRGYFSLNAYYQIDKIEDNIIRYKDVKIKIIEFNNQYIKYKILN